jgi:hypothetical protein
MGKGGTCLAVPKQRGHAILGGIQRGENAHRVLLYVGETVEEHVLLVTARRRCYDGQLFRRNPGPPRRAGIVRWGGTT